MKYAFMLAAALCLAGQAGAQQRNEEGGAGRQNDLGAPDIRDENRPEETRQGEPGGRDEMIGGITHEELLKFAREKNMAARDLGFAAAIAQRSGRSFSEVAEARKPGMEWEAVAARFGLQAAELRRDARDYERDIIKAGLAGRADRRKVRALDRRAESQGQTEGGTDMQQDRVLPGAPRGTQDTLQDGAERR